ncbi:MAG: GNAT family N-acetyltransferase [Pseudolysinimonas sp.]
MSTTHVDAMRVDDVEPLARLHRQAFPDFFLSTLGEPFLRQFYQGFLGDPAAVTVVLRDAEGMPCGSVVGTTEPAGFFGRLVRRRWAGFALAGARAVLSQPGATPRLVRALRYRGDAPHDAVGALLSSICLDPSLQGSGEGGRLVAAWEAAAASSGARSAFLTTDADHNEAVNRFYSRHGWLLHGTYSTREGRQMNRYMKELRQLQ